MLHLKNIRVSHAIIDYILFLFKNVTVTLVILIKYYNIKKTNSIVLV